VWRWAWGDTADAALAFLQDHADGVVMVFTDVPLPGRADGVDLTLACAARWPHIGVLVTSRQVPLPKDGLPRTAHFMPEPWRALDVLVAVEKAAHGVGMPTTRRQWPGWDGPATNGDQGNPLVSGAAPTA
jgi:hypothetical protein